jgi:hypothetical protein
MSKRMNAITTPRTAPERIQCAVSNVAEWATEWNNCPTCGNSAAAYDHVSDDTYWQSILKVRLWLADPGSDIVAEYVEAKIRGEDGATELDHIQFPDFVFLETREADAETQRAIADLISWSVASVQTEYCGNSLGPDKSAVRSIAELRTWLGMTSVELELPGQRWTFKS